MGLDAVEIVMRTEEVFGIDLPDDDCAQARTVGDLYALVLKKLGLSYQSPNEIEDGNLGRSRLPDRRHLTVLKIGTLQPWDPADVWRTLKALVQYQLQVDPDDIKPDASFVDDLGCD